MVKKLFSLLIAFAAMFTVLEVQTRAAPPATYEALKGEASDHLHITVIRIEQIKVGGYVEVEVEAEVSKVLRSKSKLSIGDKIVIQYHRWSKERGEVDGWGWPITPLMEEKYEVYLNKTDRIRGFIPAAARESFVPLK